jgi:hypothetical protein
MTTRLLLTSFLSLTLAGIAFSKPVLHGSVGQEGDTSQSTSTKSSTSLGRSEIKQAPAKESKEVELAWDAWHKQLAEAIYARFDILAFQKFQDSPPLGVKIQYVVTKDGKIVNLKIVQKSSDMIFDALACQAILWQARKPQLLKFPEGSNRQSVEKFATFTQNMGDEGYQATEGDKETVNVNQ